MSGVHLKESSLNIELSPGAYTVIDSHPASWSYNAGSAGQGFVLVKGHLQGKPVASSASSSGLAGYRHYPKQALSGYNDRVLKGVSVEDCAAACDAETAFPCASFDYYTDGSGKCQLSKSTKEVGLSKFSNVDHYHRLRP